MSVDVDPMLTLLEDEDPLARSRAHTELGLRAKARADDAAAIVHLREAIDLDPTDETPREALRSLGVSGQPDTITEIPKPGFVARLWRKITQP
jgi:hypothetical protein